MDIINSDIIQQIGTAIAHSIWQIGGVAIIYLFLSLTVSKAKIRLRYTSGIISLALILLLFIFTLITQNSKPETAYPMASENQVELTTGAIHAGEWVGEEIAKTKPFSEHIKTKILRFKAVLNKISGFIGVFWLLGIVFFAIRRIQAYSFLRKLQKNKRNVYSQKWQKVLDELALSLNLERHIKILFSPSVNSPFTFGFFRPVILFPIKLITGLTEDEIKCILIHELAHNLRNDYLFNIFQTAVEVLFFYHPAVMWISKEVKIQRELICDNIVTSTKVSKKVYINTLIRLGELNLREANVAIAAKRNKNELLYRIKHILNKYDAKQKKSNGIAFIVTIALVVIISAFTIYLKKDYLYSNTLKSNIETRLAPYGGSFAFYDFKNNRYYMFNDSVSKTRFPTYSTFKIASSLIAFDIGIAADENYTIKYDSLKYPLPAWMKNERFYKNWYLDHTIKSAMNYSVNWYYKELGARIGNENIIKYLNNLNYGNKNITPGNNAFWYNGQLKISGVEQVDFIKNIINNECKDISERAQILTKDILPYELRDNYSMYGKTGTGKVSDSKYIGWYVGYLKTKNNTYAFAINIFANDDKRISGRKRIQLTKNIFNELGIIGE